MTATLMLEYNGQTHGSGRHVFRLTRDCRSANSASSLARGSSEVQVFSFQDSASACLNSDLDVWLIDNLWCQITTHSNYQGIPFLTLGSSHADLQESSSDEARRIQRELSARR